MVGSVRVIPALVYSVCTVTDRTERYGLGVPVSACSTLVNLGLSHLGGMRVSPHALWPSSPESFPPLWCNLESARDEIGSLNRRARRPARYDEGPCRRTARCRLSSL